MLNNFIKTDSDIKTKEIAVAHAEPKTPFWGIKIISRI